MPVKFLLFIFLLMTACGTTKQKAEEHPAKETEISREKPEMDLKQCPCGRSDWEKLPPGYAPSPQ